MSYTETVSSAEAQAPDESARRARLIVRTSAVGIGCNLLLVGMKAAVGLLSGSIAIVMDAVNNLSDAAASVITILGAKLAGRAPDKKHPFGYGRVEYLSAMVIALLVLYAGITSAVESVKAILHPEKPEYAPVSLILIAVGVLVKVFLGRYVKSVGERVNSDALVNSGEDARLDAVISASTLAAALLYFTAGISLEAWLAAVISVIILRSGAGMLRETISQVLGERADAELASAVKETVCSFPQVQGAYDLILHNYGPESLSGSIHVEVPESVTARELDALTRAISGTVYERHRVILTAVGVYSVNTSDGNAAAIRSDVIARAMSHPHVKEVHGFYLDEAAKTMRFDVLVDFDAKDRQAVCRDILSDVRVAWPDYQATIQLDSDFA